MHSPAEKRRLRASYFGEETAALHKALGLARRSLRSRVEALRLTIVRCAFLVWRSGAQGPAFECVFCGRWLGLLRCNLAFDTVRVSTIGRLLRNRCRKDKASFVSGLADELQQAPDSAIHAAFKELVRPKKFLSRTSGSLGSGRRMGPIVGLLRMFVCGGGVTLQALRPVKLSNLML